MKSHSPKSLISTVVELIFRRHRKIILSEVAGNKRQAPIGHGSGGLDWNPISFFKNTHSLQENPPFELTQPQTPACLT